MTYLPGIINFTFSFDRDNESGYIVHEVSNAFSFAMIPVEHTSYFETKEQAAEQVRRLHAWQQKGNVITLRCIETPERFEAVADTKYGCAW
jgi:hypothetical protein